MSTPSPSPSEQQSVIAVQLPRYRVRATYILLGVTVAVYLLQMLSQALLGADYLMLLGANNPIYIAEGQIWRLITPLFLHGSLMHIGFNMYALAIIGRDMESIMGGKRLTALYFATGFAGNVLSFLLTQSWSLGASTAIFGLATAEGVFIVQNRRFFGQRAQYLLKNTGLVIGINLLIGMSPGIDNWGHIGGLLGALLFAPLAGPKLKIKKEGAGSNVRYMLYDSHANLNTTRLAASLVVLVFGLLVVARLNAWL